MDEPEQTSAAPPPVEEILRDHAPRVYNLARRILGNDADAEDVTQEVLVQVLQKLQTFRGEASFATWLHRITVNAALAHRRKRSYREEGRVHAELEKVFEEQVQHLKPVRRWSVRPDEEVLDGERQRVIESAISQLPENYRDVYVLADVEGLPNVEVADILGLHVPGVKSRLHRARLMLRDSLAPYFEEVSP